MHQSKGNYVLTCSLASIVLTCSIALHSIGLYQTRIELYPNELIRFRMTGLVQQAKVEQSIIEAGGNFIQWMQVLTELDQPSWSD